MSQGTQLLSAICQAGSIRGLAHLNQDLFTDEEQSAVEALMQHARQYGVLPTLEVMNELGHALCPVNQPVSYYLERVRRRAIGAQWNHLHPQFARAMGLGDINVATRRLEQMVAAARQFDPRQMVADLSTCASELRDDYRSASAAAGLLRGITFGWEALDHITGGATAGDLYAFVARPKTGKTYGLIHNALAAWKEGKRVLFVSMEASHLEIARRACANLTKLNPSLIRAGRLSWWGQDLFDEGLQCMSEDDRFYIVDGALSASVRDVDAACLAYAPDIVFIDAVYLLAPESRSYASEHERIQNILREVKQLALRRHVPVVFTTQFNREASKSRSGGDLEHIGGSDWIGQIASCVIAVSPGRAPNERTRRLYRVIAGRDMEMGCEFETNFSFQPFDMSLVAEDPNYTTHAAAMEELTLGMM